MSTSSRAEPRFKALSAANGRGVRTFGRPTDANGVAVRVSDYFGCNVFGFQQMKKALPPADVKILQEYAVSGSKLTLETADKVALAVKEWAISRGASHYTHWFQPQTGSTAEKHDAFFGFEKDGTGIELFNGKLLIQQEPDASSFPSGGRRATFEARGYTIWDASSPMFIVETTNGATLCIPSLFVSYSGEALDKKTPLLRSIHALNEQAKEALQLIGEKTEYVTVTCGPEQEYFLVDESLWALRPDLIQCGRSLIGAHPPKGQQLEDHYFGAIKPRILNFMMEVEHECYKLGVPLKTRHNEVAPAQYECAPIFEFANLAADHNQIVMEVIKNVAKRHQLQALFHEKPFDGVNGSGKHVNWSMATAEGVNLLNPGDKPHENIRFLYFLAATLKAVHENADLLRASVAPAGNEFRMGANEAPPAIISAFLGDALSEVVEKIASNSTGTLSDRAKTINMELAKVPEIAKDNTDRNRTSPFAFTGNKFEFRACGASQSVSDPTYFLNTAVAEALRQMNSRLRALSPKPDLKTVLALIAETFKASRSIQFDGDGYSKTWHEEASKRGLANHRTTPEALSALLKPNVIKMFADHGVMTPAETEARYNVFIERYNKIRLIELETMNEILLSQVYPAAIEQQTIQANALKLAKEINGNFPSVQLESYKKVVTLTDRLLTEINNLDKMLDTARNTHDETKVATFLADKAVPAMSAARLVASELEEVIDDTLWPIPKYRELLHIS